MSRPGMFSTWAVNPNTPGYSQHYSFYGATSGALSALVFSLPPRVCQNRSGEVGCSSLTLLYGTHCVTQESNGVGEVAVGLSY